MSLAIAASQGQLQAAPRGVAPAWLQRACRRGMSAEPGDRWPDMRALLDALRRGQARSRSRRWIAGAAAIAALAGGLLGARALERRAVIAACVEDGASVEELWPGRAEAVRAGVLGSELAYAAASHERLTPWLERWAGSWRVARQQACEQHELARETSPELYARSRSCLEVARARLEGLVEQLERGEAPAIQRAVAVAAALRPPGECLERARLERGRWPDASQRDDVLELQRRLAKIAAHEHAGSFERGLESAELALADATALGWAPMTAAARLRVGALLERAGKYEEAARELKRAYLDAGRVGADATAADAALALSYTLGSLARHEEGLAWGEHAEMMIDRLGEREQLRGAELLHNLGTLRWIRSEYREALELFQEALALRESLLSAEHPLLGSSLSTIGTTYHLLGETRRAIEHADRALAIFERVFGPSHPNVANVLNNRGNFFIGIEEFDAAIQSIERALEIREAALGREHPDTLGSINSLGTAHFYLERYDEAHRLWSEVLQGSLKSVGPEHPDTAGVYQNLGNVERERGALEAARAHHARALEIFERTLGADHVVVAGVLNDLGLTHDLTGAHAEAVKVYERALSIYERHAGDAPNKYRLQFTLARSLLAQGERARALAVARESLAGWRALDDGTYDAKLRELERWIAAHEDQEVD